jgi:hypothetical protein
MSKGGYKQMKLSTEATSKLLQLLKDTVSSIEDEKSRIAIELFIEENTDKILSAPASNKADYHNCFPCGLLDHTLRVFVILRDIVDKYDPDDSISRDSLIKVALLHDMGKIGDETNDYYVPQTSDWHRDTLGQFYQTSEDLMFMAVAHRSIYWAQRYNIPLTKEEFQAIMIHDGQFTETNRPYANKECLLAVLLHMSDMLALHVEKNRYKKFASK